MEKNEIITAITEAFIKKYFDEDACYWWVNDETGTVFYINDFWFNFEDMLYCICNNITTKRFFSCYSKYEKQLDSLDINNNKVLMDFLRK